jgi:hypothetical protein
MEKKYIYANLKIPIEIKENKQVEPLQEYIQFSLEECPCLPEKQDIADDFLMDFLANVLKSSKTENTPTETTPWKENLFVLKNEIKNDVRTLRNTSFKTKIKSNHRYSMKCRNSELS